MGASNGSLEKGSDHDCKIICEPCKENGKHVKASGYCENCDEYLCKACVKVHCLPRPYKHHVVLNKHEMPKSKTRNQNVTSCTDTCNKHPNECLKFFCKDHDVSGCSDCMFLDHKSCNVDYISTLAKDYNKSAEYTSIIQKVNQLHAEVNSKLTVAGQSATTAEAIVIKAIADIKQHRKDVNDHFDEVKRKLVVTCKQIKSVNQLAAKNDELKSSSRQITSLHASLTTNNTANLFVRTKETRTKLVALEDEIRAIKKSEFKCVKFVKNDALISERSSAPSLGELKVSKI